VSQAAADGLGVAAARGGPAGVAVDPVARTVELRPPAPSLDFGGIAKGWALDRAAARRAAGVPACSRSREQRGGDRRGAGLGRLGHRADRRPGAFAGRSSFATARSTSGSRASTRARGPALRPRGSPRSGEPLRRARVAVVVAADGARAEALSKALLILGEQDGIALVERAGDAEGVLLDEAGERFETSGWVRASHYARDWPEREPE
jgi:thiamine biosynthesis lipoprotein